MFLKALKPWPLATSEKSLIEIDFDELVNSSSLK
jgi:hypothetical protein